MNQIASMVLILLLAGLPVYAAKIKARALVVDFVNEGDDAGVAGGHGQEMSDKIYAELSKSKKLKVKSPDLSVSLAKANEMVYEELYSVKGALLLGKEAAVDCVIIGKYDVFAGSVNLEVTVIEIASERPRFQERSKFPAAGSKFDKALLLFAERLRLRVEKEFPPKPGAPRTPIRSKKIIAEYDEVKTARGSTIDATDQEMVSMAFNYFGAFAPLGLIHLELEIMPTPYASFLIKPAAFFQTIRFGDLEAEIRALGGGLGFRYYFTRYKMDWFFVGADAHYFSGRLTVTDLDDSGSAKTDGTIFSYSAVLGVNLKFGSKVFMRVAFAFTELFLADKNSDDESQDVRIIPETSIGYHF